MKILSFGEILWDVYPDKKYIGGAPFNFAAHLAKHKQKVYMLSALGADALGKEAAKMLDENGVSAEFVSVSQSKQTGKCLVTLDENSVPAYNLLQDVAYDYINCENVPDDFDILYFGTLSLRSEYNFTSLDKLLKKNTFKEIFVDVNIRPPYYSEKTVRFAMEKATILKISLEELPAVSQAIKKEEKDCFEQFAKEISSEYRNLKIIIVTLGAKGAFALDCKSGKYYNCAGKKVKVASTVGAGDSFCAAFLHQYVIGNDIQLCLEYAAAVAGFVVSGYDAVPNYNMEDFI